MIQQQRKQSGFGIIYFVVAILVLGILVGGGWFVYQRYQVQQANKTTEQVATGKTVVRIPELHIQITVPDDIKDLTYRASNVPLADGRLNFYAMFSTKRLTAMDAGCGNDSGPLGSLGYTLGQYPTTSAGSNSPNELEYGVLVKQFPTFFIAAGFPQGACTMNQNIQGYASQYKQEFDSSFSTIEELK